MKLPMQAMLQEKIPQL